MYKYTTSREVLEGGSYTADVEIREYEEDSNGHVELVIHFYQR